MLHATYSRSCNVKLVLSRVKSLILLLAPSLPGDFACFISFKINLFNEPFRNTMRISNRLDSSQGRHFVVGSNLGQNCFELKLLVDDKKCHQRTQLNAIAESIQNLIKIGVSYLVNFLWSYILFLKKLLFL